jgi:hypothetical protein
MKPTIVLLVSFLSIQAFGQGDKSLRPSPPAVAKVTLTSGANVIIDYSQPAIKGRTIGKDVEPYAGKIWRTGANEATVFEIDKDVKVQGETLPAGKYALFTIMDGTEWTVIFNKTWKQWGAFSYKEADDALRVKAKADKAENFAERMTFTISDDGKVKLNWGDTEVKFKVE